MEVLPGNAEDEPGSSAQESLSDGIPSVPVPRSDITTWEDIVHHHLGQQVQSTVYHHDVTDETKTSAFAGYRNKLIDSHAKEVDEILSTENLILKASTSKTYSTECPVCQSEISRTLACKSIAATFMLEHIESHAGNLSHPSLTTCPTCYKMLPNCKLEKHMTVEHSASYTMDQDLNMIHFTNGVRKYDKLLSDLQSIRLSGSTRQVSHPYIPEESLFSAMVVRKKKYAVHKEVSNLLQSNPGDLRPLFHFKYMKDTTNPHQWMCALCDIQSALDLHTLFANDISMRFFALRHMAHSHSDVDGLSEFLKSEWELLGKELNEDFHSWFGEMDSRLSCRQRSAHFYIMRFDDDTRHLITEMFRRGTRTGLPDSTCICIVCCNSINVNHLSDHFLKSKSWSGRAHSVLQAHAEKSEFHCVPEIAEAPPLYRDNFPSAVLRYSRLLRLRDLDDAASFTFLKWQCLMSSDCSGHVDDVIEFPSTTLLQIYALRHLEKFHTDVFSKKFLDYEWDLVRNSARVRVDLRHYCPSQKGDFDIENPSDFVLPFQHQLLPSGFKTVKVCAFCFWTGSDSQFLDHIAVHHYLYTANKRLATNDVLRDISNEHEPKSNYRMIEIGRAPKKILGPMGKEFRKTLPTHEPSRSRTGQSSPILSLAALAEAVADESEDVAPRVTHDEHEESVARQLEQSTEAENTEETAPDVQDADQNNVLEEKEDGDTVVNPEFVEPAASSNGSVKNASVPESGGNVELDSLSAQADDISDKGSASPAANLFNIQSDFVQEIENCTVEEPEEDFSYHVNEPGDNTEDESREGAVDPEGEMQPLCSVDGQDALDDQSMMETGSPNAISDDSIFMDQPESMENEDVTEGDAKKVRRESPRSAKAKAVQKIGSWSALLADQIGSEDSSSADSDESEENQSFLGADGSDRDSEDELSGNEQKRTSFHSRSGNSSRNSFAPFCVPSTTQTTPAPLPSIAGCSHMGNTQTESSVAYERKPLCSTVASSGLGTMAELEKRVKNNFVWTGPPPPEFSEELIVLLKIMAAGCCPICPNGKRIRSSAGVSAEDNVLSHMITCHGDNQLVRPFLDMKRFKIAQIPTVKPLPFLLNTLDKPGQLVCSSCGQMSFPRLSELRCHHTRCMAAGGQLISTVSGLLKVKANAYRNSPSVPDRRTDSTACVLPACISRWRTSSRYPESVSQVFHMITSHVTDKDAYEKATQMSADEDLPNVFPFVDVAQSFAKSVEEDSARFVCATCQTHTRTVAELVQHAQRYHRASVPAKNATRCPFGCTVSLKYRFTNRAVNIVLHVIKTHLPSDDAEKWLSESDWSSFSANEPIWQFDVLKSMEATLSRGEPYISCKRCNTLVKPEWFTQHAKSNKCTGEVSVVSRRALCSVKVPKKEEVLLKKESTALGGYEPCNFCTRAIPRTLKYSHKMSLIFHTISMHRFMSKAVDHILNWNISDIAYTRPFVDISACLQESRKCDKRTMAIVCAICQNVSCSVRDHCKHVQMHADILLDVQEEIVLDEPCASCDVRPRGSKLSCDEVQQMVHVLESHSTDEQVIKTALEKWQPAISVDAFPYLDAVKSSEQTLASGKCVLCCSKCSRQVVNCMALLHHASEHNDNNVSVCDTISTTKSVTSTKIKGTVFCELCGCGFSGSNMYDEAASLFNHYMNHHQTEAGFAHLRQRVDTEGLAKEFPFIALDDSLNCGKWTCALCSRQLAGMPQLMKHARTQHTDMWVRSELRRNKSASAPSEMCDTPTARVSRKRRPAADKPLAKRSRNENHEDKPLGGMYAYLVSSADEDASDTAGPSAEANVSVDASSHEVDAAGTKQTTHEDPSVEAAETIETTHEDPTVESTEATQTTHEDLSVMGNAKYGNAKEGTDIVASSSLTACVSPLTKTVGDNGQNEDEEPLFLPVTSSKSTRRRSGTNSIASTPRKGVKRKIKSPPILQVDDLVAPDLIVHGNGKEGAASSSDVQKWKETYARYGRIERHLSQQSASSEDERQKKCSSTPKSAAKRHGTPGQTMMSKFLTPAQKRRSHVETTSRNESERTMNGETEADSAASGSEFDKVPDWLNSSIVSSTTITPSHNAEPMMLQDNLGSSRTANVTSLKDALGMMLAASPAKQQHSEDTGSLFDHIPQSNPIAHLIPGQMERPVDISHINGVEGFKCVFCSFVGRKRGDVKNHIVLDHNQEPRAADKAKVERRQILSPCLFCDEVLTSREKLLTHISTSHKDKDKPYPCSFCNSRFVNIKRVREHELRQHNLDTLLGKQLKCSQCGQQFKTIRSRDIHEKLHKDPNSTVGRGF